VNPSDRVFKFVHYTTQIQYWSPASLFKKLQENLLLAAVVLETVGDETPATLAICSIVVSA
jgi:uncharacterized protein (DUF952 family)